ncbi:MULTISPECIES: hypothetical protein [unclassified Streptomyces]|uniref:hypothetical protein n=1 Tax=unclassified Streptomyces TaxID=2593676 RepID=UPI0006AD8EF0|nr:MULTISPECIES: hypothetical protein [unclassified Streptomyces]
MARDSFAQGLAWIATGAVPVMLALAVTATALLRNVGRGGETADHGKKPGEADVPASGAGTPRP